MAEAIYIVGNQSIIDIADAIREKNPDVTGGITVADMPQKIRDIPTGGGGGGNTGNINCVYNVPYTIIPEDSAMIFDITLYDYPYAVIKAYLAPEWMPEGMEFMVYVNLENGAWSCSDTGVGVNVSYLPVGAMPEQVKISIKYDNEPCLLNGDMHSVNIYWFEITNTEDTMFSMLMSNINSIHY